MPAPFLAELYPGDSGWGDAFFSALWGVASLLLAAYYCYRAFIAR
ncbi:MAG TPA: hypothetical protein VF155_05510 [Candidatus Dormibacteraeota bacterium]